MKYQTKYLNFLGFHLYLNIYIAFMKSDCKNILTKSTQKTFINNNSFFISIFTTFSALFISTFGFSILDKYIN